MTAPSILDIVDHLCWSLGCVAVAFLLVWLAFKLFNIMPAAWFCDYGEKPGAELQNTRLFFTPTGVMCSLLTAFFWIMNYTQYGGSLFFFLVCALVLVALMIALSDYKYSIIPDQFTAVALILCVFAAVGDLLGPQLFLAQWWQPLAGGAAGFLLMMLVSGLGRILYHKQGVGFGDVKLFAALGILLGLRGIITLFLLAIFLAFFHFVFLLLRKTMDRGAYLPLGPYICAGLALLLAFRTELYALTDAYLALLHF